MSFSIPGVSVSAPLPPLPPAPPSPTVDPVGAPGVAGGVAAPDTGLNFGDSLTSAMEQLGALHKNADTLATKVATGELKNPHEYLMAAQEASITTQTAVAVRNKALEAFNEIMRMPL
ncbi:flagellar hook-basal body complex protein FliE [bacterium]|nr:flagellar hook-basal body complex protein FliE [bacterium]MDA9802941.1 flagellar hook-basal body complex protein FliE [bacterium]